MSVTKSLFSLLKTNNGHFKSDKQKEFLLSHCQSDRVFTSVRSIYNNSFQFHFICDDDGVVRVEKHTSKKIETYWERDPDHDAFMKRLEAQAEEKRRRVSIAQRFERIRIIVNNKNADSTDRLLRMMKGKEGDALAKSTMAYLSIENKIKKLDGLSNELLEEMNNWN